MKRRVLVLLIAVSYAIGGCGSAGPVAATPAADQATVPSPMTASGSPLAGTAEPAAPTKPTPAPTLASTMSEATQAPAGAISVAMGKSSPPRFFPDHLTSKAGEVVFFLTSVRSFFSDYHNLAIGPALHRVLARSRAIQPRHSALFTVEDLPPGSYTFWCEISGHWSNGMVGTLTVTP